MLVPLDPQVRMSPYASLDRPGEGSRAQTPPLIDAQPISAAAQDEHVPPGSPLPARSPEPASGDALGHACDSTGVNADAEQAVPTVEETVAAILEALVPPKPSQLDPGKLTRLHRLHTLIVLLHRAAMCVPA